MGKRRNFKHTFMKKYFYTILLSSPLLVISTNAQYISTMDISKKHLTQTNDEKPLKSDEQNERDTLKLDLTGSGVSNLSAINAATAALGMSFYDIHNKWVLNIAYSMSGTNIFNNNQGTLSYLFFPDLSASSGSMNLHFYPPCCAGDNDKLGVNFITDYNGQRLSKADSMAFSVSTYNIALGLEYIHTEIGEVNRYKIILGGNINIIGINADSLTGQNNEILNLEKNRIVKNGYIIGSNWYAMLTINQQFTTFIRLYNTYGNPSFNRQFGAILFSFGVSVNTNAIHIL
jgi:hypothetical protein